ncbi:MAG TPA: hypothetical protein VMR70_17130 [Flavisolibacter sp.]|nr:hypothetical protein [Flavisolibacter sp.]
MKLITIILACLSVVALHAQNNKPATNYLGTASTISFQNKAYQLAWSSHPTTNYYKQEYLLKGDAVAQFQRMLLLEVVTGVANAKEAVAAKAAELNALKKNNPFVQYDVFDNKKTGEYILDFLLTANNPDGSISIVERNVYRYKSFTDKKGITGVLLFGVSERGDGNTADTFLAKLKKEKSSLVNAVAAMVLPVVKM